MRLGRKEPERDRPRWPTARSEMVGLDTASFAWRSSDSGATWSRLGGLGEVQAIASFDAGVAYAINAQTLFIIQ
jgi:hypothetical protein